MMWSAFLLGLLGSFHCAAMCGPLMLGLGARGYSLFNLVVHHVGRWIGYSALAVVFRLAVSPLYLFELQQYIAFLSGGFLIVFGLKAHIPVVQKSFAKLTQAVSSQMNTLHAARTGSLFLGILNGLLPCGLSFGAAILSLNTATFWQSAVYMVIFGLGTMPMLWVIAYLPRFGKQGFIRDFNQWTPKLMVVIGVVVIIRSAGWGIPFISPTYNAQEERAECCHR
jgi:sulfite exporter TauE/SafE